MTTHKILSHQLHKFHSCRSFTDAELNQKTSAACWVKNVCLLKSYLAIIINTIIIFLS